MRKQKGATLPSAIIFSTILLLVSIIIVSLVYQAALINKTNTIKENNSLIYLKSHNEYVSANHNKTAISDEKYYWNDYHDGDIYALVCTTTETSRNIKFYSIYDFEHDALLAYQESNIYIEERVVEEVTHYYLGGYVEIWGSEV